MRRKQKIGWTMLAVVGALASWGCANAEHFHSVVVERAAYDLQCDAGGLTVTELPGMAYGVRGCGQQATYVMSGSSCLSKQLTEREVGIHCTPILDHSASEPEPEPPTPGATDAPELESEPEPEPKPEPEPSPL